ncbi:hypothetical protein PABG_12293 [Paracoccidioides brasiliensis Pb03]|nr:hypothetical protein PABG_12293 [Paracoccidioides brasiliensis Pb03]
MSIAVNIETYESVHAITMVAFTRAVSSDDTFFPTLALFNELPGGGGRHIDTEIRRVSNLDDLKVTPKCENWGVFGITIREPFGIIPLSSAFVGLASSQYASVDLSLSAIKGICIEHRDALNFSCGSRMPWGTIVRAANELSCFESLNAESWYSF